MDEIPLRRPRVLLLLHELSLSGAPRMALQTFQTLASDVDLRVLALEDGPLRADFERLGPTRTLLEWVPEGLKRAALQLEKRVAGPRGLMLRLGGRFSNRLFREWQPDLIYINSVVALHFGRYMRLPGVPALLHVHETGAALHSYRLGARGQFESWPTQYIAVSLHTRAALLEEGVSAAKISVVGNFLGDKAHNELLELAAKRTRKAPIAPFVVGGAGPIGKAKGSDLWLEMAAELTRLLGKERVRFRWIGGRDTSDDTDFIESVARMGLSNQFEMVAHTPRVYEHFATLDALAFTSREDSFGLVVLENMALGNIVTCFAPGGGAREMMGDLMVEASLVIPDFSAMAMARALARAWGNPAQLARLQSEGMRRAHEFDAQKAKTQLLEIISRTLTASA